MARHSTVFHGATVATEEWAVDFEDGSESTSICVYREGVTWIALHLTDNSVDRLIAALMAARAARRA